MVDQIQLPPVQAFSQGADFSQLANLGNVYQAAQEKARQQQALASLGQDPVANAQMLIKSGVPSLATLGLNLQQQSIENARANEQLSFQRANAARQAAAFEEDSPEARTKKVVAAGLNPTDPASKVFIATGQNFPGPRAGLGAPIITQDPSGQYHMHQLTSDGKTMEVQFPEGQRPLTPGELAGQKQEAISMAKAKATAAITLPKLADVITTNIQDMNNLAAHAGRDNATGRFRGQLGDESTLLSQEGIDFRSRFKQVKGEAYLNAFDTLRGAGAISNQEGEAGKAAINRLSTVTSKEEFDNALNDAKKYYLLGLERTKRAAAGDFSMHPPELRPADYGISNAPKPGPNGGIVTGATAAPGTRPPLSDIFSRK